MQNLTFKDIAKKYPLKDSPLPNGTIVRITHGGHTFSSYTAKFVEMNFPRRKEGHGNFPDGAEGLIMGHTKHCDRSDHYGWIYHIVSRDGNNHCLMSGHGFVALGHVSSPYGQVWQEARTLTLQIMVTSDLNLLHRRLLANASARDFICASAHPHYDPSDDTLKGIITTDAADSGVILIRSWYDFLRYHIKKCDNHDSWNMLVKELWNVNRIPVGDEEVGPVKYTSDVGITADFTHMLMRCALAEGGNPFRRNVCAFGVDGRLITEDRYIRKTLGIPATLGAATTA